MKNDGGPAFPHSGCLIEDEATKTVRFAPAAGCGMSLRDWLASTAKEKDIRHYQSDYRCTREGARYRYADAMLKAREGE